MWRYYWEILFIRECKNINLAKLHTIDLSMAKLSLAIGTLEGVTIPRGHREDAEKKRHLRSSIVKGKKKREKKQRTIDIYYTIENRDELGPYILSNKIIEKWPPSKVPSKKAPSRDTIVTYLREEKLIK